MCLLRSATHATKKEGGCRQVPRLPRKMKVDVAKCHGCHAKRKSMSPSATLATQDEGQCRPKRVTRASPVLYVPRLLRKVKVDVAKCHACHANGRGDHGGKRDPSASPEPAQCRKCHFLLQLVSLACLGSSHAWCHYLPSKVLEHFVQARVWAVWHWVIFVQLLGACDTSIAS